MQQYPILVKLLISILVTFRVAQLLALDDGPFRVMLRFRQWLGRCASGRNGKIFETLADLFNCPYCLGVWIAALVAVVLFPEYDILNLILIALCIAGGQAFLQGLIDNDRV